MPTLWDKKTRRIVNNESSEIIRMLNSEFTGVGADPADFYPKPLRSEIDRINARNLQQRKQRRLSLRLRKIPSRLRGSLRRPVRHARRRRGAAWPAALSGRQPHHRSRLAAVPHIGPLRCRVFLAIQMQQKAHRRLSEPFELHARTLRGATVSPTPSSLATTSWAITRSNASIRPASFPKARRSTTVNHTIARVLQHETYGHP